MPPKRRARSSISLGRSIAALTAAGLAMSLGSGSLARAQDGLRPEAGSEPVVVDLTGVPAADAARLAARLPEWEEAINAGTQQLSLPLDRLEALLEAGFELTRLEAPAQAEGLEPWPACYHRLDEVYSWLEAYADEHPELIELYDIGDSWCKTQGGCSTPGGDVIAGRDILVARITAEGSRSPKEGRFWMDGGIHARELPAVELMVDTVRRMVEGYGQDAQLSYLLDHRELYVGIASNPDGRDLVELGAEEPYAMGPWMWRKNARDESEAGCGWPPLRGHHGVDLNRNQDFKWDAEGHSTNPCAETYRGQAPASEPEIQAYASFLREIFEDQRGPGDQDAAGLDTTGAMINFHNATWPGTTLVPWGWTDQKSPNDAGLWAIGQRYSSHNGYRTQYSLYPVSGNTRDWGYGELGIPAYVVELQGRSFVSPCSELPGILRQNQDGIDMMLGLADRPYLRVRGPEVTRLRVEPSRPRIGQGLRVRARVTDLRGGGDAVAEARLAVARLGGLAAGDLPTPDLAPEAGLALRAEDGAFDERSEWVVLDLDTDGLLPGRYYLTLRGRDDALRADAGSGYWGSAAAAWFEILAAGPSTLPPVSFD